MSINGWRCTRVLVPFIDHELLDELLGSYYGFRLANSHVKDWLNDEKNIPVFVDGILNGYVLKKEPEWVVEGDKGYLTSISISRGSSIGWSGNSDKSVAIKFTDKKKARAAAFLSDGRVVPLEEEEK